MRFWSPEVIVVSILFFLVMALLGPALLSRREQARDMLKRDRLAKVGLSLQSYHDTYRSFPANSKPTRTSRPGPAPRSDLISPF